MPNYDHEHTVTLTSGAVGKTTFTVPCDLAAEVERLTIENKRLQWLMLPAVSGRGKPLGYLEELRVEVERLHAIIRDREATIDTLDRQRIDLGIERDELQAALEKHHWPDIVPGDGPCETCGLDASVWYRRQIDENEANS